MLALLIGIAVIGRTTLVPAAPTPTGTPIPTVLQADLVAIPTDPPDDGPGATGGRDRFLAPDGSDDGKGTEADPWRTLAAAGTRLRAGDTLWVRGGSYPDTDVSWTHSGTADAPITVRAYPGETPRFDGGGTEERFLWIHEDAGWIVVRGLAISGYGAVQTGVIALSDGAHDVTLRDLDIEGRPGGATLDHLIYLSAPGVHDVTIDRNRLAGAGGAAIHVYHEPGATAIRIRENLIEGGTWGVLLYSGSSDVLVRGNHFAGVDIAVKLDETTDVRLIGNEATGRRGIVVVGPPIRAEYLDVQNVWPAPVELQAP